MTISVFPPHPDNAYPEYQARIGELWVCGKTLSGTIANAIEAAEASGNKISALKVIVQELGGDAFFSEASRARRYELTAKQQEYIRHGKELPEREAQELEELIHAEIEASAKRAEKLSDEP